MIRETELVNLSDEWIAPPTISYSSCLSGPFGLCAMGAAIWDGWRGGVMGELEEGLLCIRRRVSRQTTYLDLGVHDLNVRVDLDTKVREVQVGCASPAAPPEAAAR